MGHARVIPGVVGVLRFFGLDCVFVLPLLLALQWLQYWLCSLFCSVCLSLWFRQDVRVAPIYVVFAGVCCASIYAYPIMLPICVPLHTISYLLRCYVAIQDLIYMYRDIQAMYAYLSYKQIFSCSTRIFSCFCFVKTLIS